MAVQIDMVGIVVRDMAKALNFYRKLGLDIPEGVAAEPHVEVTTPNGYRIAWDTEEMIRGICTISFHKNPWEVLEYSIL